MLSGRGCFAGVVLLNLSSSGEVTGLSWKTWRALTGEKEGNSEGATGGAKHHIYKTEFFKKARQNVGGLKSNVMSKLGEKLWKTRP